MRQFSRPLSLIGKLAFFLSSSEITKRVPKLDLIRKYYRAELIYLNSLY